MKISNLYQAITEQLPMAIEVLRAHNPNREGLLNVTLQHTVDVGNGVSEIHRIDVLLINTRPSGRWAVDDVNIEVEQYDMNSGDVVLPKG